MPRSYRPPSYRLHKPRNCGVVTIDGRNHYLGKYGSPESHEKYARLIAEWNLRRGNAPVPALIDADASEISINELILRYLVHAEEYYRRADGSPTGELDNIRDAVRPLKQLYGRTEARGFRPKKLEAVRQSMIESGLARSTINSRVGKIRRMFRWGSAEELVPPDLYHGLKAIGDLKIGRSAAREPEPVRPVPDEDIEKTVAKLNPCVAAMVRVQLLTAMRPQDVRNLRTRDLDMSQDVWVYTCWRHKTEHLRHTRRVAIGPLAQAALRPFLKPKSPEAFVFSPKEAAASAREIRDQSASTAVRARRTRRRNSQPKRSPGDQYTKNAYRRAIARACERAAVSDWHPHQLRHTRATWLRKQFGLHDAKIVLGHQHGVTTEIYAEADFERAIEIMREVG